MANPRVAKFQIETVTLICPNCDEIIAEPNGSLYWTRTDIDLHRGPITCDSCNALVKLPYRAINK